MQCCSVWWVSLELVLVLPKVSRCPGGWELDGEREWRACWLDRRSFWGSSFKFSRGWLRCMRECSACPALVFDSSTPMHTQTLWSQVWTPADPQPPPLELAELFPDFPAFCRLSVGVYLKIWRDLRFNSHLLRYVWSQALWSGIDGWCSWSWRRKAGGGRSLNARRQGSGWRVTNHWQVDYM